MKSKHPAKHHVTKRELIDEAQKYLLRIAEICTMLPDEGGFKNPSISTNQVGSAIASLRTL